MTQKVLIFSCFFQNISFKRLLTHFPPRVTGTYHATNWHITLVQQEYHNSSAVHITHHRCISLLRSKNITTAPLSISRTTGAYHSCTARISRSRREHLTSSSDYFLYRIYFYSIFYIYFFCPYLFHYTYPKVPITNKKSKGLSEMLSYKHSFSLAVFSVLTYSGFFDRKNF